METTKTKPSIKNSKIIWNLSKATASGFMLWTGETLIGLIPLMGHLVVNNYSKHIVFLAYCQVDLFHCMVNSEIIPLAEVNVVSVVTCGLAILSFLKFGPEARYSKTPMTYITGLGALGSLIFSSILYALTSAGIDVDGQNVTLVVLIFSLIVSFYLALEESWLRVLRPALSSGENGAILQTQEEEQE